MYCVILVVLVVSWLVWRNRAPSESAKRQYLKDKVILITGASSGIGKACCFAFQNYGSRLVLCSRNVKELEAVREELEASRAPGNKTKHLVFKLDVSDESNAGNVVRDIASACGDRIDILINNAGLSQRGTVMTTTMDVYRKVFNVNFFGNIIVTKAVLPYMVAQQSGQIVGVGSIQSKVAIPFRSGYSASKHAVQGFFDSLRLEVHGHNIKVTTFNPGYVNTSIARNALSGDGSQYGKSDSNNANGMSPEKCAEHIVNAVVKQTNDVAVGKFLHVFAIKFRCLFPDLFFWVMRKRSGL